MSATSMSSAKDLLDYLLRSYREHNADSESTAVLMAFVDFCREQLLLNAPIGVDMSRHCLGLRFQSGESLPLVYTTEQMQPNVSIPITGLQVEPTIESKSWSIVKEAP